MASTIIAYGRALYYPYINFKDEAWAKTAALYYKGLDRIVPEGYGATNDVEIIRLLNEQEAFTRNINPRHDAEMIGYEFMEYATSELHDPNRRAAILKKIGAAVKDDTPFRIHSEKLAYFLQRGLPELGLANRSEHHGHGRWFEFEPVTGAMYMTFLANHMAANEHLPVVTDDAVFQPLINNVQLEKFKGHKDNGETLASMVIKSVVPEDITNIPAKKIIAFRKRYDDERHLFYGEVNKLVKDIESVDRESTLKECLEAKRKDIELAVNNIDRAFKGMGIATAATMLGLSVPAFASGQGTGVAVGGILAIATAKLLQQENEYYKARKGSPYSYVLSLKTKLKSATLAEQLLHGKLII